MQKNNIEDRLMHTTDCPICGAEIGWPDQPQLRQTVFCTACKGKSKVTSVSPLELDEAVWDSSIKGHRGKRSPRHTSKRGSSDVAEDPEFDLDDFVYKFHGKRSVRPKRRAYRRLN